MPELNYDYQATRDVMFEIMNYWADVGVTGFRIDAVKHIFLEEEANNDRSDIIIKDEAGGSNYNSNLTKNLHYFRELNYKLKQNHPDSLLIGENFDGSAYQVAPYYEGLDSMLNFHMYFDIWNALNNDGKAVEL